MVRQRSMGFIVRFAAALAAGLVLTLVSALVPRRVEVTHTEIMGCETGCDVAARGFPVPFIADYPGISPVGSADLVGALLGMDNVLWLRAAVVFAFWTTLSFMLLWWLAR